MSRADNAKALELSIPYGYRWKPLDSTVIIAGAGTSTAGERAANATANKNFFGYWFDSTATSGDVRGIYMRIYAKGVGGSVDAMRAYATMNAEGVVACQGLHGSCSVASTIAGTGAGLGVGVRGTVDPSAANVTAGGSFYGVIAETVTASGSHATGASCYPLLIRCLGNGNKPIDAFAIGDAAGPISTADGGGADADTAAIITNAGAVTAANFTARLHVKINGTRYRIPLDPV